MLNKNKKYGMLKRTVIPALTLAVTLQATSTGVLAAATTINNNSTKENNESDTDYNRVITATRDVNQLFSEEGESLKVAVLSDPHYFPEEYVTNKDNQQYKDYMAKELYLLAESAEIFIAALDMVEKDNPDILIIPGDMTKNGELLGTEQVSYLLKEFEKRTGIDVFVINGNHDIYDSAFAFNGENGDRVNNIETVTIDEYLKLYGNFGYEDNEDKFQTEYFGENEGEVTSTIHPELSYVARPKAGYVILSLNSQLYTTKEDGTIVQNGGGFNEDLLSWAEKQIKKAEENGETIIAMAHHGVVSHSLASELSEGSAVVRNWEDVATRLADAGLRYIFTGHMHENDIAEFTTPSGNTLYDIETAATTAYGAPVRSVEFEKKGVITEGEAKTKEVVTVSGKSLQTTKVTHEGKVYGTIDNLQEYIYDFIYKDSRYLEIKLGGALDSLIDSIANINLYELIFGSATMSQVFDDAFGEASGVSSISKALENNTLSDEGKARLEQFNFADELAVSLAEAFDGKTIETENKELVTFTYNKESKEVIVSSSTKGIEDKLTIDKFLKDIVKKIDDNILNKDVLKTEIEGLITNILEIEVFETEDGEKKTLRDVINLFLIDHFLGAEDLSGWAQELLDEISTGKGISELIDNLINTLLDILPSLLNKVDVDVKTLTTDFILQVAINAILGEDKSLYNALTKLGIDLVDVIKNPINEYLGEYITPSFEKQMGVLIGDLIYGLAGDDTQDDKIDGEARVLIYEGTIAQEPSVENGLLPHSIAVTFGKDETTEKAFSWYTGKNVQNNQIEYVEKEKAIFDENGNVNFSNAQIKIADSDIVKRPFPTIDLGLIAITKDKDVTRHQIVLDELTPGTKYYYRVGNGVTYSPVSTFETAAVNTDSFTFLNFSDTQSMLESEYETWASVVDTAFNLYPDAKFVTHAGDMVDNGKNELQWQWFLNKPQEDLMGTSLITASGNHEEYADYSQTNHFNIQDLPEQDLTTGAYYKVDYGNTLVMVLNTNNLNEENALTAEQITWLRNTANESDAKWKIIQLHKAPYSNGSHYTDADVVAIREQLDPIVTELGIDLVLEGHDHTYARSEFLVNGEIEEGLVVVDTDKDGLTYETAVNPDGTMYAITGTSGVKFYDPKETGLPLAFEPDVKDPVFAAVTVEKDTLYYKAYTVNVDTYEASLLDSYSITKDEEAPVISGIENGGEYFVDKKIEAIDNLQVENIMINGVEVENGYELVASNENNEYTVVVTDIAGNSTSTSFTMKALPTVDDIKFDEVSRNLIDSLKAEFELAKDGLSAERIEYFQNLIDALENAYNLQKIEDILSAIDELPSPEEVTADHVNKIKALVSIYETLTPEQKESLGDEANEKIIALSLAIKTSSLVDSTNAVVIEHTTEDGYFEIDTTIIARNLKSESENFEIKAIQNNIEIQPNGNVKVTINLGEKAFEEGMTLGLISADGLTTSLIETTVVDNQLVFSTDKLGTFKVTKAEAPANKGTLADIILEAEGIDTTKYTEESVKVLMRELEKAKVVLENENVTQEEVDNAVKALNKAIENLKEKVEIAPEVNKDELKDLVELVSSFDTSKYTEATVKLFNEALDKAKSVFNDENATQEEVDEAIDILSIAFMSLQEKPDSGNNSENNSGNSNGSNNESGNGNESSNGNNNGSNNEDETGNNGSSESSDGNNSSNDSDLPKTGGVSGFSLMAIGATLAGIGLTLRRKKDKK